MGLFPSRSPIKDKAFMAHLYPMVDVFTLRVMKTGFVIRQIERLITDQPRSSGKDRWKISLPKMSR